MNDLTTLSAPQTFAVVAQGVVLRYHQRLASVSDDAFNHATLLARRIVNDSKDYLTAEILPALLTCVIDEIAAEPDSFPKSAPDAQQGKTDGGPSAAEALQFGKTCTETDLLKLLVLVHAGMSDRAPELARANSAALTRSIEQTLQTEQGNTERVTALFTDIAVLMQREA